MARPYKNATAPDGKTIVFDIRHKIFLLIQCNFDPMDHIAFFENEILSIESIKRMDSIGVYPDGSGYVIYLIQPMTFLENQLNELIETFVKHFTI